MSDNPPLLEVNHLSVNYHTKKGSYSAVKNVSFTIERGKTLGLVGESGCGKSTIGKSLLGLIPNSFGTIKYNGNPLNSPIPKKMQMIFQDPYGSLNPRMRVDDIIAEPIDIHHLAKGADRNKKVLQLLDSVGLPHTITKKLSSEISGGQRQRIGIARALALNPEFIFCDEPTSSLDAHHQMEIINLLRDLQNEFGLTYLFVSHDLPLIRLISHEIAVMYRGEIVEFSKSENLYNFPKHTYTQKLLGAIPIPDPRLERERQKKLKSTFLESSTHIESI